MQLFKKILCPVDFSDYSEIALRYAVTMARENAARLVICHAIPQMHLAMLYADAQYFSSMEEVLRRKGEDLVEEFAAARVPPDVEFNTEVLTGNPSEEILNLGHEENADLIVLGTHGQSGFDRFIVGSVTNKILHRSEIPVLVVTKPQRNFLEEDAFKPVSIERMLCPIDFEMNNSSMVPLALSIARAYQSEIDFFHVVHKADGISWPDQETYCLEKLRELVKPEKEEWCTAGFLLKHGNPAEEILKVVEQNSVELVVMGHHGRGPVEEFFLGSVTRKVVTQSSCPVLVVRAPAHKPVVLL